MTSKLAAALGYLQRLIHEGAEYPDAHSKVCACYKLTPAQQLELADLYDEVTC